MRHAYKFNSDFSNAIIKALGLEDRKIRKLRIEMEVNEPVTLYVEEYATFDDGQPYLLANILELARWQQPQAEQPSHSGPEAPNRR